MKTVNSSTINSVLLYAKVVQYLRGRVGISGKQIVPLLSKNGLVLRLRHLARYDALHFRHVGGEVLLLIHRTKLMR